MPSLKQITILWGICDICSIGWYLGWRIFHTQIPFYYDIIKSIDTNTAIGFPSLAIVTIFSLFLYVSLIFSGIYLIKLKKVGAILTYVQTPFRLFTFIPPSIFFITWPLKHFFRNPGPISAAGIVLFAIFLSEGLKLWTIIQWHRDKATPHEEGKLRGNL